MNAVSRDQIRSGGRRWCGKCGGGQREFSAVGGSEPIQHGILSGRRGDNRLNRNNMRSGTNSRAEEALQQIRGNGGNILHGMTANRSTAFTRIKKALPWVKVKQINKALVCRVRWLFPYGGNGF